MEAAEGTREVVVHLGGVAGGRQVDGEDNPEEGKKGREEEGVVVAVAVAAVAGEALGLEEANHPCHHQRSPYLLQKNMEKPDSVHWPLATPEQPLVLHSLQVLHLQSWLGQEGVYRAHDLPQKAPHPLHL